MVLNQKSFRSGGPAVRDPQRVPSPRDELRAAKPRYAPGALALLAAAAWLAACSPEASPGGGGSGGSGSGGKGGSGGSSGRGGSAGGSSGQGGSATAGSGGSGGSMSTGTGGSMSTGTGGSAGRVARVARRAAADRPGAVAPAGRAPAMRAAVMPAAICRPRPSPVTPYVFPAMVPRGPACRRWARRSSIRWSTSRPGWSGTVGRIPGTSCP